MHLTIPWIDKKISLSLLIPLFLAVLIGGGLLAFPYQYTILVPFGLVACSLIIFLIINDRVTVLLLTIFLPLQYQGIDLELLVLSVTDVLIIILCLSWGLRLLGRLSQRVKIQLPYTWVKIMTILALFYLLQLTATLGAENRISAFHSLLRYTQIYLMVFFLSLGVSYRRYDIRLLTVFLAFQALLSAGHWILQSANLGGINTRGVISSRELTVFAGVHRLAFALPGLIPILVSGWVTYPRSRITRWVFVGSILLVVLAVLLTYSRLGFFGMIIAGGLIFLSMRQLLPWHQMAHLSLFILIGFIVLAFAFQSHEILWDRIEETYYTQSDESLRRRIILTKASLTFIAKNPMLGLGPGDFALGEGEFGFPKTTHATHNVYLQVAVESGVPSLLIFFALMALLFAKAYTQLKNLSIYHPGYSLLAGCLISLIVYLIEGMADSVGLRSIHFWYIIALTLGVVSALSMKDLEIPSYKSPQP